MPHHYGLTPAAVRAQEQLASGAKASHMLSAPRAADLSPSGADLARAE
jgi:hypothetical protein